LKGQRVRKETLDKEALSCLILRHQEEKGGRDNRETLFGNLNMWKKKRKGRIQIQMILQKNNKNLQVLPPKRGES